MSIVLEEINPIEAPSDTPVSTIVTESQASEPPGLSTESSAIEPVTEVPTIAPKIAAAIPKKRGRPKKEAVVTEETPVASNGVKAATKAAAPKTSKAKAAPKEKKPKPPPIIEEEDSSESDVDETLRNVYNHVARPDMETAILQFLVNRKQTETQRRRTLWSQLAQM